MQASIGMVFIACLGIWLATLTIEAICHATLLIYNVRPE